MEDDVATGVRADCRLVAVALALILALVGTSCGTANKAVKGGPGSSSKGSGVEVTLDVFSGRPNPSWILSGDDVTELARRLTGLAPSDKPAAEDDLGYRGFRITNADRKPGLPFDVIVANGVVTIHDQSGDHRFVDSTGIERWLVDQARQRGYGSLVEGRG